MTLGPANVLYWYLDPLGNMHRKHENRLCRIRDTHAFLYSVKLPWSRLLRWGLIGVVGDRNDKFNDSGCQAVAVRRVARQPCYHVLAHDASQRQTQGPSTTMRDT